MTPEEAPARQSALAIDIGGTQARAALVGADGTILARHTMATGADSDPGDTVTRLATLISDIGDYAGGALAEGVGVCAAGPLDTDAGIVLGTPTLPRWDRFPLRDRVSDALGRPVTLAPDAPAALLGECRWGAARGATDVVYVTVSTGIGGGVLADGRLLRGHRGLAGHIGHMTVTEQPVRCFCGRLGCWEAVASGSALAERARQSPELGASAIAALAGDQPPEARHIAAAARQGDRLARHLMAEEARWLAAGMVDLIHLYSPQLIVMGGGLSAAWDLMGEPIRQGVAAAIMPAFGDSRIVPAQFSGDSGLLGAASLVLPEP
jgi:glucokinase